VQVLKFVGQKSLILLTSDLHSRRVCFLLIWTWSVPNCSAHRSRDLQNTFYFTVFHIPTVNNLRTDCEDYIISCVYWNIAS